MARLARLLLTCAVAGATAACGESVINYSFVSDNYRPYDLNYAASKGGMLTEVVGNPFPTEKEALDRRVTKSLEESHFGPELPFFTVPPGEYRSPYRVVVLFNPAPSADGIKLCSPDHRPQGERQGSVRVLASFCASESRISTASGTLPGATGPDDPAFQHLMRQIALNLFPPYRPDQNDRGDFESN